MSNCPRTFQPVLKVNANHIPVNSNELLNSSRMVAWIFASVAKSMLLVASSRTIIELRRSRARAMAISCLWPCEKLVPPADTLLSNETVVLGSISVVVVDIESAVSSCSYMDAARDAARDVAAD